jgi:outer membrane protein TolC
MRFCFLIVIFVMCLFCGFSALSQPINMEAVQSNRVLTLSQVQSLALRGNREIRRVHLEVTKSEAAMKAVQSTRYPTILGLAFIGQQVGGGPTGQNLAVLPGVFEPVTQQYRLGMQVKQANIGVQIARQQLRLAKQNVIADAKKTYLQMVALQSAIKSRRQNLAYLQTLVAYVDSEVRRGATLKVNLTKARAKEATAEYELARDSDDYITAGQTLNQLLDRPLHTVFEVSDEQLFQPASENAQVTVQAVNARPELFRIRLSANIAKLEQKVVLSRYIPDISFGATGIFSRQLDISLPRSFVSVGFLGVWEPWDWGRRMDLAKVATRERQQSLIQLSDLSDKISVEADNAQRAIKVVEQELKAANLTMSSMEEELRIVDRRYKAGAALLKDVIDAQKEYSEAISNNVKAKTDYASAQVVLDKAIGKDFD